MQQRTPTERWESERPVGPLKGYVGGEAQKRLSVDCTTPIRRCEPYNLEYHCLAGSPKETTLTITL